MNTNTTKNVAAAVAGAVLGYSASFVTGTPPKPVPAQVQTVGGIALQRVETMTTFRGTDANGRTVVGYTIEGATNK